MSLIQKSSRFIILAKLAIVPRRCLMGVGLHHIADSRITALTEKTRLNLAVKNRKLSSILSFNSQYALNGTYMSVRRMIAANNFS